MLKYKRIKLKTSKDFAYLCGVYCSDGSVIRSKNSLRFSLNVTDKEFAVYVRDILLDNEFDGTASIKEYYRKDNWSVKKKYQLCINCKNFCNFLIKHTKRKNEIPLWIKKNKKCFIRFLEGMIDGDGFVSETTIVIGQKNKNLLNDIRNTLLGFGMRCGKLWVNNQNVYGISIHKKTLLKNNLSLHINRKKDILYKIRIRQKHTEETKRKIKVACKEYWRKRRILIGFKEVNKDSLKEADKKKVIEVDGKKDKGQGTNGESK